MIGRGSLHLTPGEREEIGRLLARVFFWFGRAMGWPWWGSLLAWFGLAGVGAAVYVLRDRILDWLRQ